MNEPYDSNTSVNEVDLLVSRIVDQRESEAERERFEQLAAAEPQLWRSLSMAQQQAMVLAAVVNREAWRGQQVSLPTLHQPARRIAPWALACSGWAAAVLLTLVLVAGSLNRPGAEQHFQEQANGARLISNDQLMRAYLQAPFVLGEMEPMMIELDELPDGRIAVRFFRRIEEVAFLDPSEELPIDDEGYLTKDADSLRASRSGAVYW